MKPPADLFQEIWRDHAPRVRYLTLRFPLQHQDELFSCGMIGLWKAWQKYDPSAGSAGLWGFAFPRVLGSMRDYLRTLDLTTRHERNTSQLRGQDPPTRHEVGLQLPAISSLPCPRHSVIDELTRREIHDLVRDDLLSLPRKYADILHARYFEETMLAPIGRSLGVSESRACQLEQAALAKLRDVLEHDPRLRDTLREISGPRSEQS